MATLDPGQIARAVRAAESQSFFREVNERIEALNESFSHLLELGDWICECSNTDCLDTLCLTVGEYEAIRAHPARFPIIAGHEQPEVEIVVETNERYIVVEKVGEAARIAHERNPRSADRAD